MEFGEWLCANVLKRVPHRHFVFSIPKILRRYSLYDRKPLHDLSRCAWESLKDFLQGIAHEKNSVPGAVIAIRTFGDLLGFNAHCHILITDGCFCGKGMLRVAPLLELKKLETLFRYKIFLCGLPGNPALCSLRQAAGHTPDVTIILILHWGNGILKI
ncbi:MAG: transposase [Deltaproteobacteria bacterium]|nr:transposase [Deltaproteobacteria bacterium]